MTSAPVSFDEDEAVEFLQGLIRLRSVNPPGDEAPVAEAIAGKLSAHGIPVDLDAFAPGRANAVARLRGGPEPAVVLSGHLDTVTAGETPWDRDPFCGDLVGGRIWGRGAADMKSGLAAMVIAMCALADAGGTLPRDVVLAASAGEEVDCCGAARLVERGVLDGAGGLVVGEPTSGAVAIGHRGALWLEIETRGRAAHGSMPSQGVNAIMHMHALLSKIANLDLSRPADPLLGSPTLAVTSIKGGAKVNVIPDRCTATLDIRTLPGQSHSEILRRLDVEIARLRDALPDLDAGVRVLTDRAPVVTPAGHRLVRAALQAASAEGHRITSPVGMPYFSDASVYVPATGLPVILYGPGETTLAHQPDEWVERNAYLRAIRFYVRLVTTWG
jgi:succinyl-diaminopimelate desuccinylase